MTGTLLAVGVVALVLARRNARQRAHARRRDVFYGNHRGYDHEAHR